MRKPWSMHKRNGIYQTQLYDYKNKRYCTAKSTGTKDRNEADLIAYRWAMEFDSGLATEYTEWVKTVPVIAVSNDKCLLNTGITTLVQTAYQDAIAQMLQDITGRKNAQQPYSLSAAEYEDAPEEVKPLLDRLSTLTFYEYILLYWNYSESPYIKGLIRKGETPPNPERFRQYLGIMQKYARHFPQCLLTEISGAKIDTLLGLIKNAGNLKVETVKGIRSSFIQALRFAYRNNLLVRDVTPQITRDSKASQKKAKKEAEKAIFTKEELKRLFMSDDNPFRSDLYRLINELLFKTGCRIGELQALQIQDFIKDTDGYALRISKNYCRAGNRLKCTKTERVDIVPISADLAARLIAHIEKHPAKDSGQAFIFSSVTDVYKPLRYESINKDFNKTMKKLGFKRPNLTLHSYRHTFATCLSMAGHSEGHMLYITRHESTEELHRYTNHYTPDIERIKHQATIDIEKLFT